MFISVLMCRHAYLSSDAHESQSCRILLKLEWESIVKCLIRMLRFYKVVCVFLGFFSWIYLFLFVLSYNFSRDVWVFSPRTSIIFICVLCRPSLGFSYVKIASAYCGRTAGPQGFTRLLLTVFLCWCLDIWDWDDYRSEGWCVLSTLLGVCFSLGFCFLS